MSKDKVIDIVAHSGNTPGGSLELQEYLIFEKELAESRDKIVNAGIGLLAQAVPPNIPNILEGEPTDAHVAYVLGLVKQLLDRENSTKKDMAKAA